MIAVWGILLAVFLSVVPPLSAEEKRSEQYVEYENLVLSPLTSPFDTSAPNYRALYLQKTERYEEFLRKYPNSPLTPEVKLRIAEFYRDIPIPKVYEITERLYRCTRESSSLPERNECLEERDRAWATLKHFRDPEYVKKAVDLLWEIVENYGHTWRYVMLKPHIGGFQYIDEEAGGYALYLLARGAAPKDRVRIYSVILEKFKIREEIRQEIEIFMRAYRK